MVRLAIVGLGKMGLSHLSIIKVHPDVDLVGVCDTSRYLLDMIGKYTGAPVFSDFDSMLRTAKPQALIVATPSRFHESIVRTALQHDVHVFCEKPFCLSWTDSNALAALAESKGLVNQVGYHYRFVATFQEMKRLLDVKAIGTVSHVLAEAYGPVVLRPKGMTWRSQREEGGGCLYDYAAHPVNLLNWFFGMPGSVGGTVIDSIFSKETDDEVYGTVRFVNGPSAQLSVNWSDESYRKMTVKISAWGSAGRIVADRQECQVYLRGDANQLSGYKKGWNVRYTTELTKPVWFYLRGEEYSAQLDYFVESIGSANRANVNSFASAAQTDHVLSMMRDDANSTHTNAGSARSSKKAVDRQ